MRAAETFRLAVVQVFGCLFSFYCDEIGCVIIPSSSSTALMGPRLSSHSSLVRRRDICSALTSAQGGARKCFLFAPFFRYVSQLASGGEEDLRDFTKTPIYSLKPQKRQLAHPPPWKKQRLGPNGGCGALNLNLMIYGMKLNLLMERETA